MRRFILIPFALMVVSYMFWGLRISDESYATHEEMSSHELTLEIGAVTDWVPTTATDIHLTHHSGTDNIWVAFSFPPLDNFYSDCAVLNKKNITRLPTTNWANSAEGNLYPDFVKELAEAVHQDHVQLYRCGDDFDHILAVDPGKSRGYVWQYEDWLWSRFSGDYIGRVEIIENLDKYSNTDSFWRFLPEPVVRIRFYQSRDSNEAWAFFRQPPSDDFYSTCTLQNRANFPLPSSTQTRQRINNIQLFVPEVQNPDINIKIYHCFNRVYYFITQPEEDFFVYFSSWLSAPIRGFSNRPVKNKVHLWYPASTDLEDG